MTNGPRLQARSRRLGACKEELLETVETDTAVKLFAARNMPQSGEAERARREDAIQLALRAAADVPLEVMRLSAQGLQHAVTLAGRSPRAASVDLELGDRATRSRLQRRARQYRGEAAQPH